jgi:hypothetical protein
VPSPSALYVVAGHAAQKLGLVCPPLNPALWLQRYLAELQLPEELLPLALQLHGLYQPAALVPTADTAPHRNPWGRLLAVLVVAGAQLASAGRAGQAPALCLYAYGCRFCCVWHTLTPTLGSSAALPITHDPLASVNCSRSFYTMRSVLQ